MGAGAISKNGLERVGEIFTIAWAAFFAGLAAWGTRRDWRHCDGGAFATLRHYFDGARPLVLPVAVYLLLIIVVRGLTGSNTGDNRLWPLFLAGAAFVYLWWLALLLFDLVFAWHRYIRNSVAHDYLYALRKGRKQRESNPDKVAELSTQTAAG
jgi:hypothetical protein